MTLGIVISCMNYASDKPPMKYINIFFQFIPQIIFLWSIFGYMCVLIIIKWCTDWGTGETPQSILPMIINMFLSPGLDPQKAGPLFFPGQHLTQIALMVVAIICIPVMLLVKPLLLRRHHSQQGVHQRMGEGEGEVVAESHEEFEFAEVMIHQIIHTIEFVLGCISNTASYLRLWALSLAHSELSTVFWNRVLVAQIQNSNVALIFVGYAVWAGATFAVLLIMETLSAFLHALRLHWVEFQNKFYVGDGIRFMPFSYKKLLNGELDDTE